MKHEYRVDPATQQAIMELREMFGVDTNAAVLRKSLALARVCRPYRRADHTVRVLDLDDKPVDVKLNERDQPLLPGYVPGVHGT